MNPLIPYCDTDLFEKMPRVCLPYGLSLLDLSRWIAITSNDGDKAEFLLVTGDRKLEWSGTDPIDLFSNIQNHCLNYKLASSYVVCKSFMSLFFFDMHDRFSFFAADTDLLSVIYPFSREIIWENFVLLQDEDGDLRLQEIFEIINTV